MKDFVRNITNLYGQVGQEWLTRIPVIVATLSSHWHLKNLTPVNNMTYHYVAKGLSDDNQAIVLKISCNKKIFIEEKQALLFFNGNGSVKVIAFHDELNALLLQQVIPGVSLKHFYPQKLEFVIDAYVNTMHKLHQKTLPPIHAYPHVRDWLMVLDHTIEGALPQNLLSKAVQLKNELLASVNQQFYLHGDLHHDNILQQDDGWVAIDPKGIVGEAEFEIAAFDFLYVTELANTDNVKKLFDNRVELLAKKANLNAERIKQWVFVRLMLMAVWFVEDNGDPSMAVKLAKIYLP